MQGRVTAAERSKNQIKLTGAGVNARHLEALGDVHASSENSAVALEYFGRALTILEEQPGSSPLELSRLLRKTAECCEARGELSQAAANLKRARRLLIGVSAPRTERAILLGRSANIAYLQGRYALAHRLGRIALSTLRVTSDHSEVARVENCLGAIKQRTGHLEVAREYYENALATYRRAGDEVGVAKSLNNVANILRLLGSYREAIGYYQKAQRLNETAGNHALLAGNCLNVGIVHTLLAQWPLAAAAIQRSLQLAEQIGHQTLIVRSLITDSLLARRRNEYARAVLALERAEKIAESSGLRREVLLALEFRGELSAEEGKYSEALGLLTRALEGAVALAPEGDLVLEIQRRLADVHMALGDTVQAEHSAQAALRLAERLGDQAEGATALRVLARISMGRGTWEEAYTQLTTAINALETLGDRWELARTCIVAGDLALKDPSQPVRAEIGLTWYRRAEALAREIEDNFLAVRAGLGLARGEILRGRLDAAFHHLDAISRLTGSLPDRQRTSLQILISEVRGEAEARAAHLPAVTVSNSRLIEQVSYLLRGSSNPLEALGRILHLLSDTIGADRAFIARVGEEGGRIIVTHNFGQNGAEEILETLRAADLLVHDRTIVSTCVPADPRLGAHRGPFSGVRSFIQSPLGLPQRSAGWLYIDRLVSSGTGPFLQGDVTAVTVLAGLATAGVLEAEHAVLERDCAHLRAQLTSAHPFEEIITQNASMFEVLRLVEKVGPTDARVLIEGETGTGKGLLARCIHRVSRRVKQPFIQINCAALPEPLLESELFGHVQGSFTGAIRDKHGLFEEANHGTLFLDEVDKTSEGTQGKLLHVLDHSEIRPVGSNKWRSVDTRVICATNVDLAARIRSGRFLEDLYYRLNDIVISVPPLRERRDDIPLLIHHFLDHFRNTMEKPIRGISDTVISLLSAYDWPGNVRELEKAVRRMIVLADPDEIISENLLPMSIRSERRLVNGTLKEEVERVERRLISDTLNACSWNRSLAARRLKVSYPFLLAKIREFGLRP
jgi:transcriptional regulator with GAF, ATPase, and Fis domain/Tfp pilus assembly protein PilF